MAGFGAARFDHRLTGSRAGDDAGGFLTVGGQAFRLGFWTLAAIFLALNLVFVYRSFYRMRIEDTPPLELPAQTATAEGSARYASTQEWRKKLGEQCDDVKPHEKPPHSACNARKKGHAAQPCTHCLHQGFCGQAL